MDSVASPSPREALIARAVPQYEPRPQQAAMADAVGSAMETGKHLLVEAGTGVGKSFAYLLPAIERILAKRCKIVISTYTIALQEQLIHKDIPALAEVVDGQFRAVLVKGRHNYLGIRRLMQTSRRQQAIFSHAEDLEQLHQIEDWGYKTKDGSLSDLDFRPLPQLWQRVRSESNNCMGTKCEFYEQCFYQRARRKVEDADLLVVNHALFFSDLALRRHNVSFLPDYDCVIFDEAHNIESVASDHFGLSISAAQVENLLNGIFNPRTGRGFIAQLEAGEVVKKVTAAHRMADDLFAQLEGATGGARGGTRLVSPPGVTNLLTPALTDLSAELTALRKKFERPDDQFELTSFAERCDETAKAVEALVTQSLQDYVYWLEAAGHDDGDETGRARRGGRPGVAMRAAPLAVGPMLRETLFENTHSVILTSATLSTGGGQGFNYLRSRLGISDADELSLDSPFDYREQATIHIEAALPEPNDPTFIAAACEAMKKYLLQTKGRAFVLFTSYDAMNRAAAILEPFCKQSKLTLLVQGQGLPRGQMLERFKKKDGSVIFGTDSFWQGVDVPGDALQNVIITKLPFTAPDKPLLAARSDAIRANGGQPFNELQVPEAVLKLKQGFGRLIRTRRDKGIVVILDKRVKTKAYGRKFLEALPKCKTEIH